MGARCSTEWLRRGVIGIIKHMPGHGRALVDSHKELPVVTVSERELETDLEPFERLVSAPMGMTAHVVYEAWDPDRPASLSPTIIQDIIRERIGFDGWLMSDDIGMEALGRRLCQPRFRCRRGRLRRRASLLWKNGRDDRRCFGRTGD